MSKPDWRHLDLAEGVLREPIPDANRIALWLPGKQDGGFRHWERVANVPGAAVQAEQGICATAATSVPVRQRLGGYLGKFLQRFRKPSGEATWVLPDGGSAEQAGARTADLLLAWAEDAAATLEEDALKVRWPQATRFQRLGRNVFLVGGISREAAAGEAPTTGSPLEQAEQLLAAARKAGDRSREIAALTDLGIVVLRGGDAARAVALLEEALNLARQSGERSRATDVLSYLGLAVTAVGQPGRGLDLLNEALVIARAAEDRLAEKLTLDHLGIIHAAVRDHAGARAAYRQALELAHALGDRPHEADLLWSLAIQHAEQGERNDALTAGQVAIQIYAQLGSPHVGMLVHHLQRYRAGEGAARIGGTAPGAPATFGWSAVVSGASSPPPTEQHALSGPGLLRMAYSAVKSAARFLGSGARTVSRETHQRRLNVCAECPHHTGLRCKVCGCFTTVKAWLPHERCPLNKWPE